MKRVVLTVAAAICFTFAGFAAGNQPTLAWEGNINVTQLGKYLKLSSAQANEVEQINAYFKTQMDKAGRAKKDQDKALQTAVYGNLKLMKETLTQEQYTKYLKLMNITLQNKGIDIAK